MEKVLFSPAGISTKAAPSSAVSLGERWALLGLESISKIPGGISLDEPISPPPLTPQR